MAVADCGTCADYDGANVHTDIEYRITATQGSSCILNRYDSGGGACCYRGGGVFSISYYLSKPETYFCCGPSSANYPICQRIDSYSGSQAVPFCYSVRCVHPTTATPFPAETQVWQHTLHICNFPLEKATFARLYSEDCATYDCNSVSVDRYMLMAKGAVIIWYTKYKPLDLIVPSDVSQPWCELAQDVCQPENACYPDQEAYTTGGPFSIQLIDESLDEIEPCNYPDGPIWLGTYRCCPQYTSSGGSIFACQSSGEADCSGDGCCYTTFAYVSQFPIIA
jgi:hypothetical protein